jgi:hypothetical protein
MKRPDWQSYKRAAQTHGISPREAARTFLALWREYQAAA